jgi:phosphatidylethanolamine-binding protein (PEBP) family uncharacterized protein
VAQRTGDQRLLRGWASTASARATALALASAVVIALAGCGGGDSASSNEASTSSTGPAVAAEAGGGDGGSGTNGNGAQGQSQQSEDQEQGESGGHSGGVKGSSDEGSGKHGPRIVPPRGEREDPVTPQQVAKATVADIQLTSPAIVAAVGHPGRLAATYTCDGENRWPALKWDGVPAGTSELILYAMNVQPVEGLLFVDWAVAGLDPSLREIEPGKLPKGAIVGANSFGKRGYDICPDGGGEIYMFALYALPRSLNPPPSFDSRDLRHTITDVSGNVGLLPAVYERG